MLTDLRVFLYLLKELLGLHVHIYVCMHVCVIYVCTYLYLAHTYKGNYKWNKLAKVLLTCFPIQHWLFRITLLFSVINVYDFSYSIVKSVSDSNFFKSAPPSIISGIFTQAAGTCSVSFNAGILLILPKGIDWSFHSWDPHFFLKWFLNDLLTETEELLFSCLATRNNN